MGDAVVSLTVQGSQGSVDLVVPAGSTLAEVAQRYAREAGAPRVLPLVTRTGGTLQPGTAVGDAGLGPGAVLVAVEPAGADADGLVGPVGRVDQVEPATAGAPEPAPDDPGVAVVALGLGAAALAGVAGWAAAQLGPGTRWPAVALLVAAAALGCVPTGRGAVPRALGAPAFGAAAGFAAAFDAAPERLPVVSGCAALAAAVTAALARALAPADGAAQEGLRVWLVTGVGWFAVAAAGAFAGASSAVVWAVLFVVAVVAVRFVPALAVDVPDQYLLDLDRLAVNAWSARERPAGRRGRIVVPPAAVRGVASRGGRTVVAAAAAVAGTVAVTAPLLLVSADLPLDRVGARVLVAGGGGALLLAGRSHRHRWARALVRLAGVVALGWVAAALLVGASASALVAASLVGAGTGAVLVVLAVAVGNGWRSAWWSRKAEVAEALCGAAAVGSLVVATGLFRHLWELTS